MKTLDEVIKYCKHVAKTCFWDGCASDHRQIAEWLEELKIRREFPIDKIIAPAYKIDNKRWRCGRCSAHLGRFWVYCQKCGSVIDWGARDNRDIK